jgi:hypothetical protein
MPIHAIQIREQKQDEKGRVSRPGAERNQSSVRSLSAEGF